MAKFTEYDYSFIQTDALEECGDAKAIACIDAYPMNTDGEQIAEGYVVAHVILSKHNDVIVVFNGAEGRVNPEVKTLVEKAKLEIQEYI